MAADDKKKAPEPSIDEAPKAEPTAKGFALASIKACGQRFAAGEAIELPESRFEALMEQGLVGFDKPLAEGEIPALPAGAKVANCVALGNVKAGKVTHRPGDSFVVPAAEYDALARAGAVRLAV